jgi:hypothetical protein
VHGEDERNIGCHVAECFENATEAPRFIRVRGAIESDDAIASRDSPRAAAPVPCQRGCRRTKESIMTLPTL